MGTISTGVGLISGLNIQDIVKQLIALEARPLDLLKRRITLAQQQQLAYTELGARFLAAKAAVNRLSKPEAFKVKAATSSNPEVLTATATENAAVGSFSFLVKSLVTTHQLVSSGFASRSSTPVGAGTLTFEIGEGSVAPSTQLADLNGVQGVRRGVIRITDRSGGAADIDLRTATTVDEVLEAINTQSTARVQARVDGDHLVITDLTGLTTGALTATDIGGGFAATDLGIAGSSTTGEIVGQDVVNLADGTSLSVLNDGNGVRVAGASNDLRFTLSDGQQIEVNLSGILRFETNLAELNDGRGVRLGTIRVTNRAGTSQDIDLSSAVTVQDVVTAINASGLSVSASLSGTKIAISDTSGGTTSNLKVEDVSGFAAADLGILADTDSTGVSGSSIYRLNTFGGVLRAVQYATNNSGALVAAISTDGNGITFTDQSGGGGTATVEALNGSKALEDLGLSAGFNGGTLDSRHLIAGMNTVLLESLNGGAGVDTSELTITRLVGTSSSTETIDLSGARTLQDVISAINSHQVGGQSVFQAQVGSGSTSITIKDVGGGGITNVGGATATDLHLSVNIDNSVAGSDLQRRYISENTLLSSLNGGSGISYAKFRVTASNGISGIVTLAESADKTIGDVIERINDLGINVTAQINANGDGIELVDNAGGTAALTVREEGTGTSTAADLEILGTATGNILTGSFARSIAIDNDDTLDALVEKINASSAGVTASIINDGSSSAPYRLILTSQTSGTAGMVNYSTGGSGISFNTLSEAQDAKLVIGDPNSSNALVMTSSSNTVKDLIDGVTLQLTGTSDTPVQVNIERDVEQVVTDIKTFVDTINATFDRIDEFTKFDPDTLERGILQADSTVLRVRDRIYSRLSSSMSGTGRFTHLSQVGLTIGQGARLQLDEERFRAAFEADPEAVKNLFSLVQTDTEGEATKLGLAGRLDDELKSITETGDGILAQQRDTIQNKIDLFNERAVDMQKLLDQKEARLFAQFQAMERALSSLQGQQSALASLANAASAFSISQS